MRNERDRQSNNQTTGVLWRRQ